MDNLTNFDKLIINLSSIEKKELLEKMEMSVDLSQEPLISQEEAVAADFQNAQQEYETLSVVQKLVLFLQSLFLQKDIPSLLKDHKINVLRKKYFNNSNLADFKNQLLKKSFLNELISLKEPCRFFRKPLQQIFSYDNKQDFYAFMGGVVLPELQQELLEKTDPWIIEKKDLDQEPALIKSEIDTFFDMKMDSVSDLDCSIMNEACQSLYGLHLLCSFELNVVVACFDNVVPDASPQCKIEDVQEQLLDLAGILKALNKPPTVRALEALFLYSAGKGESEEIVGKKMTAADTFLGVIRDFNKKVPLENLVKILSGDLIKSAKNPPVIDDWFRIYRKFWSSRVSRTYAFFVNERKKNESEKDICTLTGIRYVKPVEKYLRNHYFEGSPAKYEKSFSFIISYLSEIVPNRLNLTLMMISREGEFYKKDNKAEFEKVLSYFEMLGKKVTLLLNKINEESFPLDRTVHPTELDDDAYRAEVADKIEHMDMEIETVIAGFISHMRLLGKVMNGIVIGDGGAYDTLSNISSIGGKSNTELRETFKLISLLINKMVKYISEMKVLEEKKL